MKKYLLVSVLLLAVACKGTTTAAPRVSKQELQNEQRAQAEIAKQGSYNGGQVVPVTNEMGNRFRTVATRVGIAGEDMCHQLGRSNCSFGFKLEQDKVLNAYADGQNIVVSSAMVAFATDDELANVLSHEFGHNIMGHVQTTQQNAMTGGLLGMAADMLASSQGIDTGGKLSKFGAQQAGMHYSQDFEREADYVGLYIMDKSGYNISAAPNMWRKMSVADPNGIYSAQTHPTNPERYVALNKAIEEINYKKQNHLPVVPQFRKK